MGNRALEINRNVFEEADLGITDRGSDWYFTVSAIMFFSWLVVIGLSYLKLPTQRFYHYTSATILLVAGVAYFSMGSGLGQVPIQAEFIRPHNHHVHAAGTREIFWVRYVDYFLTLPLVLVSLLLNAGVAWPTIAVTVLAEEVVVVCALVGALIPTIYKWGYFTFGCGALIFVFSVIAIDARRSAKALGGQALTAYYVLTSIVVGIWICYPIAWGVSEGGNIIHPDSEAVFYGILDVFTMPVFIAALLFFRHKIDAAAPVSKEGAGIGEIQGRNDVTTGNHQPLAESA